MMSSGGTGSPPAPGASARNATTTPLSAGGVFTGEWEERSSTEVIVTLVSDQTCTFAVQFSTDQSTVDSTVTYSYDPSLIEPPHRLVVARKYWRLVITSTSASPMTYLRAYANLGTFGLLSSPLNSAIAQDADAIVARIISDELSIASGKLVGYSIVNKFGLNPDVDMAGNEDIWGGDGYYTGFATAAEQLRVSSSSANDTSAGTGARTVRITGLDSNYAVITETVTLNGTSNVTTTQSFLRAHTMTTLTAGSGGVNAGVITVAQNVTTTNVMLSMSIGRNQTNNSAYTVPAGYTAYMTTLTAACGTNGSAAIDGNIWARSFGGVFRSRRPFFLSDSFRMASEIYGGLVFTEKSDIIIRINGCSATNVPVNASYDLILVLN